MKNKDLYDIPNNRSLHAIPKVRGGGLATLVTYLIFIFINHITGNIQNEFLFTQLSGGILLGLIGWFDDKNDVPILLRFIIHVFVSLLLLMLFNWLPSVNLIGIKISLYAVGSIIFIFYSVWLINLYNFMDGIDGIAISQLIIPSLFLAVYFGIQKNYEIAAVSTVMISSALPFYKYNWPPSRMFMGDVLSGFLGFYFATITLYINNYLNISFLLIPVLLATFIFDATFTLMKRLINREKIWIAHNSHYYQQFAKVYGHKKVTITIIILNFILYIPALLIVTHSHLDLFIAISTYFFIALLTFLLKRLLLKEIKTINNYSTGLK